MVSRHRTARASRSVCPAAHASQSWAKSQRKRGCSSYQNRWGQLDPGLRGDFGGMLGIKVLLPSRRISREVRP
jgi:hypothetical protein